MRWSTTQQLAPHPSTTPEARAGVESIEATLGIDGSDQLAVRYRIVGSLDLIRIPVSDRPLDPQRLWAHTCCELFVAHAEGEAYEEWNFSPTGQSAHFVFRAYRDRSETEAPAGAEVAVEIGSRELCLQVRVPALPGRGATLGLTAVVESLAGPLSYWALRHPPGPPDFHHAHGRSLVFGSLLSPN